MNGLFYSGQEKGKRRLKLRLLKKHKILLLAFAILSIFFLNQFIDTEITAFAADIDTKYSIKIKVPTDALDERSYGKLEIKSVEYWTTDPLKKTSASVNEDGSECKFEVVPDTYHYEIKLTYTKDNRSVEINKTDVCTVANKGLVFSYGVLRFDITAPFGNGCNILLRDSETNSTIEPVDEFSVPASKCGYEQLTYIVRSKVTYDYEVTSASPEYYLTTNTGSVSFSNGADKRVQISLKELNSQSARDFVVTVPEDADVHMYFHAGKAYAALTEVPCQQSIATEGKEGYKDYTYKLGMGQQFDIVAGGGKTPYKKTVYLGSTAVNESSFKNTQIDLELEKKGSEANKDYEKCVDSNIYTNIKDNFLSLDMANNNTKRLEAYRMEQPVPDDTTNQFVEPDMYCDIISGDDVVKVEEAGQTGRKYWTVTAQHEGTAILKITYDELNAGKYYPGAGAMIKNYPAISDKNVGIVIVNVGKEALDDSGLKLDSRTGTADKYESSAWRSDYDTVYIPQIELPNGETIEKETVEYSFTPPEGSTVSTHAPIKADTEAIQESEWETQTAGADGKITLALPEGRTIVKIEQDGKVFYATIHAVKTKIKVANANPDRSGQMPVKGDKIEVTFEEGLELPVKKMAAIYNPGFGDTIWLEYSLGSAIVKSSGTEQYHIEKPEANKLTIEPTAVAEAGVYTLNHGQIHADQMGNAIYGHLDIPLGGLSANFGAGQAGVKYYDILPDISFTVFQDEKAVSVYEQIRKLPAVDALTLGDEQAVKDARAAYDGLTEEEKTGIEESVLKALEEKMEELQAAGPGEDQKAAQPVIDQIEAIGEITVGNYQAKESAVKAAREAYGKLTEAQQKLVTNLQTLADAEKAIEQFKKQAADAAQAKEKAVAAFKKLVPQVKAKVKDYKAITVSWNTCKNADSYCVYRRTAGGEWKAIEDKVTGLSYIDKTAKPNTIYYYTVRGVSAQWGGKVRTGYATPGAKAVIELGKASLSSAKAKSYNSATLSWKKVTGATGYQIVRATSKNGSYKGVENTKSRSYTDKGLTVGKTYYYKVRAYRTVNGKKVYGAYSAVKSVKTKLGAVSMKKATGAKKAVSLSWKKVTGATGYQIVRAASKGGSYKVIATTKKLSYKNAKLARGKTYYYKVRAYRTVGGKKVYGAYSAVKSAKAK